MHRGVENFSVMEILDKDKKRKPPVRRLNL
jgi:hypothetical protein